MEKQNAALRLLKLCGWLPAAERIAERLRNALIGGDETRHLPRFGQRRADSARLHRRALVKSLGRRQALKRIKLERRLHAA